LPLLFLNFFSLWYPQLSWEKLKNKNWIRLLHFIKPDASGFTLHFHKQ
jgi:hypothetical protein